MAVEKSNMKEIGKMRLPTECEVCGKVFDLEDYVDFEKEKKKTLQQIKDEKFNGSFKCDECKK